MKKLMYLLVVGSLSVFAACGGASTTEGEKTQVASCCCDDATCDGSCHGDADAAAEAHGNHEGHNHEAPASDAAVACSDDCQKACCLGCKATEGTPECIVLADGSMGSCCAITEAAE